MPWCPTIQGCRERRSHCRGLGCALKLEQFFSWAPPSHAGVTGCASSYLSSWKCGKGQGGQCCIPLGWRVSVWHRRQHSPFLLHAPKWCSACFLRQCSSQAQRVFIRKGLTSLCLTSYPPDANLYCMSRSLGMTASVQYICRVERVINNITHESWMFCVIQCLHTLLKPCSSSARPHLNGSAMILETGLLLGDTNKGGHWALASL